MFASEISKMVIRNARSVSSKYLAAKRLLVSNQPGVDRDVGYPFHLGDNYG